MSDSIPKPGNSLESDLRLIREANGLSREDIFNKVHIRPEVLAQVEEHGFSATPTLNSDIHRRSFVKHYADAVGIDSELALKALDMSVNGLYDGSLAVEYLGLEELKPVPRWATPEDESAGSTEQDPAASSPDRPASHVPEQSVDAVFPVPEPDESDPPEQDEPETPPSSVEPIPLSSVSPPGVSEKREDDEPPIEPETPAEPETSVDPEPTEEVDPPVEAVTPRPTEPVGQTEPEKPAAPIEPVSPYAPPVGGRTPVSTNDHQVHTEPPKPQKPSQPPMEPPPPRRRETPTIPSSAMKESHIGPLDDDDLGDEEVSLFMKLRGRHALGWIGLIGVGLIILFFVGRAIYLGLEDEDEGARRVQSVEQLPVQFSGIVRLTPTTERFVTLQITADSLSTTEFEYKMWTHNAGSTFAETGVGSLNPSNNQILLGEPYGIGGLFVLENGRYRLRSVRRVRFPRWEFTGQVTP